MINITRERTGWRCTINVSETPAKYYAVLGSGIGVPHVAGNGDDPHDALDKALRNLGLLTISNPPDAGSEP